MIKVQLVNLPEVKTEFSYESFKKMANGTFKYWNHIKDFRVIGIIKGVKENEKEY